MVPSMVPRVCPALPVSSLPSRELVEHTCSFRHATHSQPVLRPADQFLFGMLQIPGLNAPIPPGASFGYQPGGWGKPPVTEDGIPLYGDVFGERLIDSDDEQVLF